MLRVFRSKKFARRTLIGLLILIIPAFVLWGAGNISKGQKLIGTIDKQKIYPDDFFKSMQGMKIELLLYYMNYDLFSRAMQNRPAINRMAWERLVFLNAAESKNIEVKNQDVLRFLSRHPLFQRSGSFDHKLYQHIIKNVFRLETRQFEELVRENLEVKALQIDLYKEIAIPDEELMRKYKQLNDKIAISYVLVDKAMFAEVSAPTPEEIKLYYDINVNEFHTPQKIELEYIKIPYANAEQKEEATSKLKAVYPKLEKYPTKLEEASEEHGLDYRRTGPLSQDDLIPGVKFSREIYNIASRLPEGVLSLPVFTGEEEGEVYLLRKAKDIPSRILSFEDAKDKIIEKLSNDKHMRLAGEKASALYEEISRKNISLEEAGKTIKQKTQTAEDVSLHGYIENIGPAKAIVEKALKTGAGNILSPINIPKGVILVRIDNIIPADEETFKEQKDALHGDMLRAKRQEVLARWFREKAPQTKLRKSLDEL